MQSWQAPLAVFATVLIATSSCDSDCEGEEALINTKDCSYYYDLLENALLNDSNNVYRLQQAFFPLNGLTPIKVGFGVTISIGGILNTSCSDVTFDKSGTQTYVDGGYSGEFKWMSLKGRLGEFELESFFFEPTIYIFSPYQGWFFVDIDLKLESLPCNPRRDTTYHTLTRLFTWAKAYARARGRPRTLDESDRGQFTHNQFVDDCNSFPFSNAIHPLLLAGFVFLNVLVMLLMVNYVPSYYHRLCRKVNSDVNSNIYLKLYWGCALVFFILSMALHLLEMGMYMLYTCLLFRKLGYLVILYLVTCISTKLLVTVVELIVCAFVCKRNPITVHIPFHWCTTNVLFCCCCCCCCSSTRKSKVVQTLALWGIMAFVQHITASLIPVGSAIISQTAEILSILALFASTVFCIIMFVVHLLHQGRVAGCQQTAAFCMRVFAIVLFIGLAVVLVTLHLMFLAAGVEFSLHDLLGSLIPSVILSAVGWYVQTRLPKKKPAEQHQAKGAETMVVQGAGVLETVVVHRNAPDWNSSESDGEQTPLFRNTN